jgi:hypothetical protein
MPLLFAGCLYYGLDQSKILASSVPKEPGKLTYFQHLKAEQSAEQRADKGNEMTKPPWKLKCLWLQRPFSSTMTRKNEQKWPLIIWISAHGQRIAVHCCR